MKITFDPQAYLKFNELEVGHLYREVRGVMDEPDHFNLYMMTDEEALVALNDGTVYRSVDFIEKARFTRVMNATLSDEA